MLMLPLLLAVFSLAGGQPRLVVERPYEPVVLHGSVLSAFYADSTDRAPVDDLFLYAYDRATESWRMMPFQIDERILAPDPYNPEVKRHTYYLKDDGLLDEDDELSFMVRDMGDQAPEKSWISNPESRQWQRLELRAMDPDSTAIDAYAYLFRSPTVSEPIPAPYEFAYFKDENRIESKYYAVTLDPQVGLVQDIKIKPPFGSGVDIFDRQKIRATATLIVADTEIPLKSQSEMLIKLVSVAGDSNGVMAKPVVRVIRESRQTFKLGVNEIERQMTFYVTAKFYPFNGRVIGGSKLDSASLNKAMPGSENLSISFKHLRQSWDLNENAKGMLYYSRYNDGIPIDGAPDAAVDLQIDRPVSEWSLVSGAQGALFSLFSLPDSTISPRTSFSLYYFDNSTGGTGDPADLKYFDTGDKVSYGDFGVSMWSPTSLDLKFEMYFLPNSVNSKSQAVQIAHAMEKPVWVNPRATAVERAPGASLPHEFHLGQNYPNPFNQETRFTFSLDKPERIHLKIFNARGELVKNLAEGRYAEGVHALSWDGRDEAGQVLPTGLYFYQLRGESRSRQAKLLILR